MPLTTFLPVIIISVVFGYFVAYYMTKSDKSDKAVLYQKGLREGEEERTALKEKMVAKDQKLTELGKERELERQAAATLKAEVDALKSTTPAGGGMDEATLQALKTAFEEKTAELLQAEQTAHEGFRLRANDQIASLEASLEAAEAARVQAQEEADQARQEASAQAAAAPVTLAELGETSSIPTSEVEARIADAVNQIRTSEAQVIAAKQLELASTAQELATARLDLQTAREQLESVNGQVKQGEQSQASSNEAIAAVNTELLRLNNALQEAQLELADIQEARQAAEAQLVERTAQVESESAANTGFQARIAELETNLEEAQAAGNSLQADSLISREEIGEWRRLYEEAEAKNQEAEARIREIEAKRDEAQVAAAQHLQESVQAAAQEARDYAALELADALAARDQAHQETLEQAVQAASIPAPTPQSEELIAMRELVVRMEGRLGDIAQNQNGQLASLTQELTGLKQIALFSRAICDGALRQAAHTEALRAQFESAARTLLDGHTAFATEVLAPVRQLQAVLDSASNVAPTVPENVGGIEALQLAIEAPAQVEVLAEA